MPKVNVKIPKGTKCNGGTVCEQDLDLDLEIPEVNPTVQPIPQPQIEIPGVNQLQIQTPQPPPVQTPSPEAPKEKVYTPEELTNLMPSGVNFAICEGNNCADTKIQNKKLVTKFKECPTCGANNVPINSNMCSICGAQAPEDEDDW